MKNINLLNEDKIRNNIASFESGHYPLSRDTSFDYCFNYFQGFVDKKKLADKNNIQISCLHLYTYLASWGMLRNSFLMGKSIKFFEPLIEYFTSADCKAWNLDVDKYDEENIDRLIECYGKISGILLKGEKEKHEMSTLVTKIMLGVFGNVPAFDKNFRDGSGLHAFNEKSLRHINDFYNNYFELISAEANRIKNYDYDSEKPSNRSYTKAKIIDTIYFIEGLNNNKKHEN